MKNQLFIDTGAFFARYVARDDCHDEALALWEKVKKEKLPCTTTNFVVAEFITLMAYRFGAREAHQAGSELYHSQVLEIFSLTPELELKALDWIRRFSDQDFSMIDAASFAVMQERGIKTAFTFDHHFSIAGYRMFSLD